MTTDSPTTRLVQRIADFMRLMYGGRPPGTFDDSTDALLTKLWRWMNGGPSLEEYAAQQPPAPCGDQLGHYEWQLLDGWRCPVCARAAHDAGKSYADYCGLKRWPL